MASINKHITVFTRLYEDSVILSIRTYLVNIEMSKK